MNGPDTNPDNYPDILAYLPDKPDMPTQGEPGHSGHSPFRGMSDVRESVPAGHRVRGRIGIPPPDPRALADEWKAMFRP